LFGAQQAKPFNFGTSTSAGGKPEQEYDICSFPQGLKRFTVLRCTSGVTDAAAYMGEI
jgi:hypothetical protein